MQMVVILTQVFRLYLRSYHFLVPIRLDLLCVGDSSGYIVGDAGGGFPPYTYTWSTSLGGIIQQSFGLNNKDTLKNILQVYIY